MSAEDAFLRALAITFDERAASAKAVEAQMLWNKAAQDLRALLDRASSESRHVVGGAGILSLIRQEFGDEVFITESHAPGIALIERIDAALDAAVGVLDPDTVVDPVWDAAIRLATQEQSRRALEECLRRLQEASRMTHNGAFGPENIDRWLTTVDMMTIPLAKQALTGEVKPIPMVLHCPQCRAQHVDRPEPEIGWTNPPHKSHKCHGCGLIWRPADIPTTGVHDIETRGKADTWPNLKDDDWGLR